jgi:hypothetical protein
VSAPGPPPPPPGGSSDRPPTSPPPGWVPPTAPPDHAAGPSGPPPGAPPGGPIGRAAGRWGGPPAGAPGHLLPLRPLTVGDTLDGAFRLLRATFGTVAVVVLLVHGPYQLVSSLALARGLPELADPVLLEELFVEGTVDVALATRFLTYVGIIAIVGLLVQVLVGGALAHVGDRADHGEAVRPGRALRVSLEVSGATLGGTVLVGLLGVGLAFAVAVLLGVLFAVAAPLGAVATVLAVPAAVIVAAALYGAYLLVLPIAVVERRGAWTTFRRALWIVRRRWWRTVGLLLLTGLLVVAVSLGFSVALGLVAGLAGDVGWVVDAVSATGSSLVTAPVTVFVALLLHLDARIRLEGHDLAVRAGGAGGP